MTLDLIEQNTLNLKERLKMRLLMKILFPTGST